MIVRELDPPHREQRIAIVLQALDIPWLKERGELTIRGTQVLVGDLPVAFISPDDYKKRAGALAGAARHTMEMQRRKAENYDYVVYPTSTITDPVVNARLNAALERSMRLTDPQFEERARAELANVITYGTSHPEHYKPAPSRWNSLIADAKLWLKWRWLRQCVSWRRLSRKMAEFLYG